jgi:hypothetical protein
MRLQGLLILMMITLVGELTKSDVELIKHIYPGRVQQFMSLVILGILNRLDAVCTLCFYNSCNVP